MTATGDVVVTVTVPAAVLPCASVAVQLTVCMPGMGSTVVSDSPEPSEGTTA